jgi:hypothetical protein
MVNLFNKEFNSNRTSEGLSRRYEIQRAADLNIPDAERLDWATTSSEGRELKPSRNFELVSDNKADRDKNPLAAIKKPGRRVKLLNHLPI